MLVVARLWVSEGFSVGLVMIVSFGWCCLYNVIRVLICWCVISMVVWKCFGCWLIIFSVLLLIELVVLKMVMCFM